VSKYTVLGKNRNHNPAHQALKIGLVAREKYSANNHPNMAKNTFQLIQGKLSNNISIKSFSTMQAYEG
jgi:hypothetical protein